MNDKVVLAYSGGIYTSRSIPWLKENYDLEVIACCINVGQDDDMEDSGLLTRKIYPEVPPKVEWLCKLHTFFSIYFVTLLPVFIDLNLFL